MDIHVQTAAKLYGLRPEQVTKEQRKRGKELNFRAAYGVRGGQSFKDILQAEMEKMK